MSNTIVSCFSGSQITNSADAARDVLIDGIKQLPHCKLLLEVSISFIASTHINDSEAVGTCFCHCQFKLLIL